MLVSGTFSGIGERAGNVAIEQVLNGLRVRFGIEVKEINYAALSVVTDLLSNWAFVQPSLTLKQPNVMNQEFMLILCLVIREAIQFFLTTV